MIGILAIAYLAFSIISAGAFNGWVRVGEFWNNESPDGKGQGFTGFLCFMEKILLGVIFIFADIQIVSSSDFQFTELPPFNEQLKEEIDTIKSLLSGESNKVIRAIPEEEEQEPEQNLEEEDQKKNQKSPEEEDFEEEIIKIPPRNFTELDRLAYIIRAIDHDCQLLPVGAVKLTPSHELRYNDNFQGLNMQNAQELKNYAHFRRPVTEAKRKIINQGNVIYRYDFLDSIENDLPKGSWSIQTDASQQIITIRSLLWPGFIGYHSINSHIYGGVYFGNGLKNVDLPFFI